MRIARLAPWLLALVTPVVFAQGADDVKKFEGTWILVSAKQDGKPVAADQVAKGKVTWKGKDVVVDTPHQHQEPIKATATTGTAGSVHTMDWTRANGPDAGKTMLAIYEFRGADEYVVVFAPAGKDRPRELDAKAGSGATMHVWKRQK